MINEELIYFKKTGTITTNDNGRFTLSPFSRNTNTVLNIKVIPTNSSLTSSYYLCLPCIRPSLTNYQFVVLNVISSGLVPVPNTEFTYEITYV